jgi:hypothetical protein
MRKGEQMTYVMRRAAVATVVALTGLAATSGAAQAGTVAHDLRTPSQAAASERPWPEKRLREAKPMPMPKLKPSEKRGLARASADPAGEPLFLEGQDPTVGPLAARPPSRNPKFKSGAVPAAYYAARPFRTNGKLFANFNGQLYTCSATVVPSRSHQVILTAGHCIHDPKRGGFADAVAFVPGYFAGYSPNGGWIGTRVVTTGQWTKRRNEKYDYAAIKLAGPQGKIGNVVGESGLALGVRRKKKLLALGYPSNLGGAQAMWSCFSGVKGRDPFLKGGGKDAIGIGCNMSFGASGGSWELRRKGRWYVNSVTSYFYAVPRFRNILFGPVLGKKTKKVIKKASR